MESLHQDVFLADGNDITTPSSLFELYTTPPRTLLHSNETIQGLGLVPAAKIYVSWKKAHTAKIRPVLFAPQTIAPLLPQSAVIHPESQSAAAKSKTTAAPQQKKTKAEKEANLLKRMMGR